MQAVAATGGGRPMKAASDGNGTTSEVVCWQARSGPFATGAPPTSPSRPAAMPVVPPVGSRLRSHRVPPSTLGIGADRLSGIPGRVRARRVVVVALGGLVLCGWCGWVSGFHRSTTPARVTWACSLVAVVVIDLLLWQGRHGRQPGVRLEPVREPWPRAGLPGRLLLVGVWPWLGLSLVVLCWEILGIDTGTHEPHLTISALTEAFRPLNAAMLLVWMLAGVAYGAARARAPLDAAPASFNRTGTEGTSPRAAVMCMHVPATMPALLLPPSRGVGVGFWVGVVVAAVAIDLVARRSGRQLANAEELIRFVTAPRVANVTVVVAWTYAGYHLFAH